MIGPWEADWENCDKDVEIIDLEDGEIVAQVDYDDVDHDRAKINVQLITALPDMLAALKRLEYWFDVDPEILNAMDKDTRADHEEQVAMIGAAIKKAGQ